MVELERNRAHPRSRGENALASSRIGLPAGSSPLTRGKLHRGRRLELQAGLIPAHAGKTLPPARSPSKIGAHPRSRGENARYYRDGNHVQGSSPLTRGKLRFFDPEAGEAGLIPAHAGKTGAGAGCASAFGAHPRSRGENIDGSGAGAGVPGSSPLTRGKRGHESPRRRRPGLIPAHAGKTRPRRRGRPPPGAHPRSRGENGSPKVDGESAAGSSPLTRGKRPRVVREPHAAWLIPAHAGKTLPDLRFYRADRSDLGKP